MWRQQAGEGEKNQIASLWKGKLATNKELTENFPSSYISKAVQKRYSN